MPTPFDLINAPSRNLFYETLGPITAVVTLMKMKTIQVSKVNSVNSTPVDPTVSCSSGPGRVGAGGDGLGWRGKGISTSSRPVFTPKDRDQECCDLPKSNPSCFYLKLVGF